MCTFFVNYRKCTTHIILSRSVSGRLVHWMEKIDMNYERFINKYIMKKQKIKDFYNLYLSPSISSQRSAVEERKNFDHLLRYSKKNETLQICFAFFVWKIKGIFSLPPFLRYKTILANFQYNVLFRRNHRRLQFI